ncbi:MAG: hypothetical protein H0X37_27515, partial [Herpetosiphonaceae bacterium]|nr:hypothetical protein [Herpetosiphonaceae bacterium]
MMKRRWTRMWLTLVVAALLGISMATTPVSAAGGTFTAAYSGGFTLSNCPLLGILRTACKLNLNASGTAKFLGPSRETGNFVANLNLLPLQCGSMTGTTKLTSLATPTNSVTAVLNGQVCAPLLGGLLGGTAPFTLNYRIVGGTGAFSNARGQGTVKGTLQLHLLSGNGQYSDHWSG